MRIIDKNQDYYDYLQDYSDNVAVFDRRNSFLLTKEDICDCLTRDGNDHGFIVVQCGATFWLMFVTVTNRIDKRINKWSIPSNTVTEYKLECIDTWKNYDVPNKLLSVRHIGIDAFTFYFGVYNRRNFVLDYNEVKEHSKDIIDAINHNDFRRYDVTTLSKKSYNGDYNNKQINRVCDIPLLKACGIANVIDAQEIFCAIEEYFSIEKTKAERTEAIGTTNNDKITSHGFDLKTSFRGK